MGEEGKEKWREVGEGNKLSILGAQRRHFTRRGGPWRLADKEHCLFGNAHTSPASRVDMGPSPPPPLEVLWALAYGLWAVDRVEQGALGFVTRTALGVGQSSCN